MSVYAPLSGQIRQDLDELEYLVAQTTRLAQKFKFTGDDDYLGTIALDLHGFYTGAERIFEGIAKEVDRSMPSGSDWHLRLLRQMSAEIRGIRPPVITAETRNNLDQYRGFRHVLRNVYTFNLRPDRIQELADILPACYAALNGDLSTFIEFLEGVDSF